MGNGNGTFFRNPLGLTIAAIVIVPAVVVIASLFTGGQIDCGDPAKDLIEVLPTTSENEEIGIQFVVCIVDGKELYEIEVLPYDQVDPVMLDTTDTGFEIKYHLGNFKVTEINSGLIVTKFKKGIELTVFYSKEALERISDEGYITPRVAALPIENDDSSTSWEELGGTLTKDFGPEDLPIQGYERVMVFKYWALPDPLIGDC